MTLTGPKLVTHILRRFDISGIDYAVARRVEYIELMRSKDDVDIVISGSNLKKAAQVAVTEAHSLGAIRLSSARDAGVVQLVFYIPNDDDELLLVRLDLQSGLRHQGFVLAQSETVISNRRKYNDFSRPCPHVEALGLLLHDIMTKRHFREGDLETIQTLFEVERDLFESALAKLVGIRLTLSLNALIDTGDAEGLISLYGKIYRRFIFRQPGNHLLWQVRRLARIIHFVFKRRGTLIAFLGPDGSGKTTASIRVAEILESAGISCRIEYFGNRTPMLPSKWLMKKIRYRKKTSPSFNAELPAEGSARERMSYLLGSIHTLLDLYIRYLVKIRVLLSRDYAVLTDRYFYDLLVNPAPEVVTPIFNRIILGMTPKPDLCFLLLGDAASINLRKPELAVPEIRRQQSVFRSLLNAPIHSIELSTDQPPQTVAQSAISEIVRVIAKKNARSDC